MGVTFLPMERRIYAAYWGGWTEDGKYVRRMAYTYHAPFDGDALCKVYGDWCPDKYPCVQVIEWLPYTQSREVFMGSRQELSKRVCPEEGFTRCPGL